MSNEIQTQNGGQMIERPSFLIAENKDDYGLGKLQQYVSPPFIKIKQSQAKTPYNVYENGTVLAVPLNMELFKPGQVFHITPVFFYPEYVLKNPYNVPNLPYARERSLDPNGELAMKCRDFENRKVICPEAPAAKQGDSGYMCTYQEVMNFMCCIWELDEFRFNPIVFTFSSTEFKTGKRLAGLLQMRDTFMYGCKFAAYTAEHRDENFGFNFENPAEGHSPWVTDEDDFLKLKTISEGLEDLHLRGAIQVDLDQEDRPAAPAEPEDQPAM